ncbi:putative glycosidase [Escovopsis weberi]|uniref:Crh-like protein n=1 Tax=Escovopsis weberi TaxID=150374 RepID=A0A0M8N4E4_ESCWE|nr:putative glycosidase [Escovopsis weberi]
MVSKTAVLALAASSVVSAQTFTDCNPLKKTCPSDPAFGNDTITCDFSKGACDVFAELPGTTLKYSDNGAVFSISTETQAPTIRTGRYILFGRVDVVVQAAAGAGIVTSSVLQSDDLDEIDWEWVGGDNTQAQTNYFSKGDTSTYDRGAFHEVDNPTGQFHKYSVEWTSQAVTWLIDDVPVRSLTAAQANNGATLPQTPMQVKLGTWVAGRKDAPEGTVQWAGGLTDFDKAPFLGYYKSISIVDYAGADGPTDKSIKEYVYGDHSGTWQSIKVVEGIPEDPVVEAHHSSTTAAAPTKTGSQASGPSKTGAADGMNSVVTVPTASSGNSTGPAPTGSNGIAMPSTIPSNSGSRGSVAVLGVLATGAGALLAQYFL